MNIKITQKSKFQTGIEIDGKDISKSCRGFKVIADAGGITRVLLDILPESIEIEGDFLAYEVSSDDLTIEEIIKALTNQAKKQLKRWRCP